MKVHAVVLGLIMVGCSGNDGSSVEPNPWEDVAESAGTAIEFFDYQSETLAYANVDGGIQRWDGNSWTAITVPSDGVVQGYVRVESEDAIYAVLEGDNDIYRWDGGTWTEVAQSLSNRSKGLGFEVVSATEIYTYSSSMVLRWDGERFHELHSDADLTAGRLIATAQDRFYYPNNGAIVGVASTFVELGTDDEPLYDSETFVVAAVNAPGDFAVSSDGVIVAVDAEVDMVDGEPAFGVVPVAGYVDGGWVTLAEQLPDDAIATGAVQIAGSDVIVATTDGRLLRLPGALGGL